MAVSVTVQKLIRVAPGTVWRAWEALPRWPQWQPESEAARWLGAPGWQEGSCFELLRRPPYPFLPARRFNGVARAVAPEQLLVWELTATRASWLGPTLVESVRLSPAPSGTSVILTLTLHGLLPTLLTPILPPLLRRQLQAQLEGLQRHLVPVAPR